MQLAYSISQETVNLIIFFRPNYRMVVLPACVHKLIYSLMNLWLSACEKVCAYILSCCNNIKPSPPHQNTVSDLECGLIYGTAVCFSFSSEVITVHPAMLRIYWSVKYQVGQYLVGKCLYDEFLMIIML